IVLTFFFQAEDGIRDFHVTGVQTCALPILAGDNEIIAVKTAGLSVWRILLPTLLLATALCCWLLHASSSWIPRCTHNAKLVLFRSEERRVGKECRPRWAPHQRNKKEAKRHR